MRAVIQPKDFFPPFPLLITQENHWSDSTPYNVGFTLFNLIFCD